MAMVFELVSSERSASRDGFSCMWDPQKKWWRAMAPRVELDCGFSLWALGSGLWASGTVPTVPALLQLASLDHDSERRAIGFGR